MKNSPRDSKPESVHRAIVGRGSIYTVATVAPVLVSIAITPLLTRTLGASQYGLVAIAISLFHLGGALFALGLPVAVTRNAIVERSGKRGAATLVLTGTAVACVCGALAALTVPLWAGQLVADRSMLVLFPPVLSSVGMAMVLLSQAFLRGLDRAVEYVAVAFAASLAAPTIGLVSMWTFGPSAQAYLWALAGGHLIVGLSAVTRVVTIARPRWTGAGVARAYRIALPTLPHQLATSFLTAALVVFATVSLGHAAAGEVQLALLIGTAPMIVLGAINNAWAPMVFRATATVRPNVLSESTRLVSAVVLVLSAGFVAMLNPLSLFIAGPEIASPDFTRAAAAPAIGVALMVVYLANIHLVFLSGRTGMLGVTTPLSALVSLTVVILATVAFGSDVRLITIGVSLFYTLQCFASFWLRKRSGEPAIAFVPALPYLATAVLITLTWTLVAPADWIGWAILAAVALTVGVLEHRVLASDRSTRRALFTQSHVETDRGD